MSDSPPDVKPDEKMVLKFLKANPDFFIHHPALLENLEGEKSNSANVISIRERQFKNLQEEKTQLKYNLSNLLGIAEHNENLARSIHTTSLEFMNSYDLKTLIRGFYENLRTHFGINHFALRLWGIDAANISNVINPSPQLLKFTNNLKGPTYAKTPICGSSSWFDDVEKIQSFVYCPVRTTETIGLLALGNTNQNHYGESKDTVYLERLVELLSASIERLI